MVMYAGRQAELGTVDEVFYESRHPYTLGLIGSIPRLDNDNDEPLIPIPGSPPSLINRPSGCPFHPRCAFREVRSEEHPSELQSLMRISYAVFCLKTKKTNTHRRTLTS